MENFALLGALDDYGLRRVHRLVHWLFCLFFFLSCIRFGCVIYRWLVLFLDLVGLEVDLLAEQVVLNALAISAIDRELLELARLAGPLAPGGLARRPPARAS